MRILDLPKKSLSWLIWLYQKTLSFDHGVLRFLYPNGYCRFYPSCSEYSRQSIQECGVVRGVPIAVKRIMRCNPWNEGGIDPPPTMKDSL